MDGFKSGFVALYGTPNVGKSTLLNAVLKEKVSITAPKPQTTRNRIAGILTRPQFQLIFWDTPGVHRARDYFNKLMVETALATLKEVDAVCFIVEAKMPDPDAVQFVLKSLDDVQTPIALAINKIDLLRTKSDLLPIIDRYKTLRDFSAIVPIAALYDDGTEVLVEELVKLLPEGPAYYPEDYVTDQPERMIVAELIREKIFHLAHEEVPYAIAVTIEKFSEQPDRDLIEIEATIHVERDSQKAIIIGKNGQMIKEIGKQARVDIEHLLGCHVYLGLFVRVQKEWRKDPRKVAVFGYQNPGKR